MAKPTVLKITEDADKVCWDAWVTAVYCPSCGIEMFVVHTEQHGNDCPLARWANDHKAWINPLTSGEANR